MYLPTDDQQKFFTNILNTAIGEWSTTTGHVFGAGEMSGLVERIVVEFETAFGALANQAQTANANQNAGSSMQQ